MWRGVTISSRDVSLTSEGNSNSRVEDLVLILWAGIRKRHKCKKRSYVAGASTKMAFLVRHSSSQKFSRCLADECASSTVVRPSAMAHDERGAAPHHLSFLKKMLVVCTIPMMHFIHVMTSWNFPEKASVFPLLTTTKTSLLCCLILLSRQIIGVVPQEPKIKVSFSLVGTLMYSFQHPHLE